MTPARLVSVLLYLLFINVQSAFAQQYKWVKGGGSTELTPISNDKEAAKKMVVDANGNIYAISTIGNTGPLLADTFSRSNAYGRAKNVFIVSYNCSGAMRWAKLIASSALNCYVYDIATDNAGHVYVAAYVENNILYIGYDATVTGQVNQHQAVMQFDTSGTFNWIRYVGPNTPATAAGAFSSNSYLGVDNANNVHFFCYVKHGIAITPTITSLKGVYDLQYDLSGSLVDVKRVQLDSALYPVGLTIDKPTGKLYMIGKSNSSIAAESNPFIASFDAARNLIWTDTLVNPTLPGFVGFSGIINDERGSLYLSGGGNAIAVWKNDTVRNTVGTGTTPVSFILKTDTAGNTKWIKPFGASTGVGGLGCITFVGTNKVAAVGTLGGKVKSGYDSVVTFTGEAWNPYFTILDTAGSMFTMQQLHSSSMYDDEGRSAIGDERGNLYIGGYTELQIWGGGIAPYTSSGGTTDFFVMKYGADCNCTASPVANFTAVGTHTVNFTYTGTPGSTPLDSVRWYFGDGGTSTVLNPSHVYSAAGTFSACVRVYSSCGGDVECRNITIVCPYSPVASFTVGGGVYAKTFNYTGTTAGVDSIRWRFGGGGTSTLTSPSHTYTLPGTYTVCVTAYTWCARDSTCTTITVPCVAAPTASFAMSGSGATRSFTYTGTSIARDSIRWHFGDGGTSTLVNPSHTYGAIGTYTVCVTFYNPCGNHTACMVVNVPCLSAPVAAYTSTGALHVKDFTFIGSTAGIDSAGWDFGDGWRGTGFSPTHTYAGIGLYTVCLRVYSACGNDTLCYTVNVPCLPPAASFTKYVTGDSTGHFSYTGTSAGIDSVGWIFGDGSRAPGTSATHEYATTGVYTVCAVAYSQCGNDTLCDTVKIWAPVSVFSSEQATIITVEPNPTSSIIHIHGATNCEIVLLDMLGKVLLRKSIATDEEAMDLGILSSATYILEITDPQRVRSRKRIIKH